MTKTAPAPRTALRKGKRTARRASDSSAMALAARWGLAARGTIYLLIGLVALQVAFGDGGKQADRGGALHELTQKPYGAAAVWAIGIGLAGMALWRLSEAAFGAAGPDGHKPTKRLLSGGRFVIYTVITVSVISYAAGQSGSGSSDKQSQDITARALDVTYGQWLVGGAGAALVGAGLWIAWRALRRKYQEHLKLSAMSRTTRRVVDVLGVVGGLCRGAVFGVAGGFLIQAALSFDPDDAKGVDDTLRAFRETPAGPWLLVVVAVGLALFGLFSFAMARWRKV